MINIPDHKRIRKLLPYLKQTNEFKYKVCIKLDLNTKQYLNQFQRDIYNCLGSLLLEL